MQATFHDSDWKTRKAFLGHTSENAFEQYCRKEGIQFEHFGGGPAHRFINPVRLYRALIIYDLQRHVPALCPK